ncbi:MAG TPA: thiamine pyrophosphate-dependent enzyme [Geminicoccaceae bacterium]
MPIEAQLAMHVLEVEDDDWRALGPPEAARLMTLLLAARRFEEAIFMLDRRGLVHGPAHSSIGQEGGAAGCIAALPADLKITGTHRAHHQVIGKIVHALYEDGFDPTRFNRLPEPMRREVRVMMAEILGLADGWTGGRGGSMHLRNAPLGIMGTNPIVGAGTPIACGIAYAEKVRGAGGIVVTFLGEGAIHQGTAHEAMHLAALYDLPLIFFVENNQYAISMTVADSTRETELLTRPAAHGIPAVKVDGMNPLAVFQAARWAEREIRERRGPVLIHADVYRYYHQSVPYPGSSFGYRTKEEEDAWRKRDPVELMMRELPARGILSAAQLEAIDGLVREAIDAAVEHVSEGQGSKMRVRPELWPDPATVDAGLSSDLSEVAGARSAEIEDFAADELEESTLIEVVPRVVGRRMEQDPSIYVFGEDVANMGGGTVGATRGLLERFPDRIVNTPICENGFCGLAVGAAMSGLRPIVELMYSDFFLVAADQLLNQAGKLRHLFGGTCSVPLVLRCRVPGAEGYGSQHSMDPSGIFALYPGWRIVAPSNAFDYIGLMNAAIACEDPVLVVEHQSLHKRKVRVPRDLDYVIPIGKARRVAEGDQITLLATLTMVDLCRDVAREMGVRADVIDLRTLSLRDLDFDLVGASVRKTGNVAVVEQSTRGTSIGGLIADEIQRRCFDWLDQPVKRIVGRWAPPTVSRVLEQAALAGRGDVEDGIRGLLRDSGQHLALAG